MEDFEIVDENGDVFQVRITHTGSVDFFGNESEDDCLVCVVLTSGEK